MQDDLYCDPSWGPHACRPKICHYRGRITTCTAPVVWSRTYHIFQCKKLDQTHLYHKPANLRFRWPYKTLKICERYIKYFRHARNILILIQRVERDCLVVKMSDYGLYVMRISLLACES